ncbi:transmembrane protein 241 isoform X2 [Oncorhynchus keta]|uniref:transmembrane protein 241 isoform X2 n=1 Tax=Oncorhynchus keta TaxID=8018 RepID=UPI00227AE11A|nr:transmembrane protein 241 isoform X2 [Oncorhynchus keta]
MHFKRHVTGLIFCLFYVVSYFTNKYVLSVLKFTYPTLFQGWQTFIGGLLLLLSGKLGLVDISGFPRSAALSWLPGSLLFVGNIYAGSRALSRLPIPFFFTLHNASEVVNCLILKLTQMERIPWMKLLSVSLLLMSAINLPLYDPQFDPGGYMWALAHLFCVGAYRVFQTHFKSSHLSDLEQQYINYLFSVLLLAFAAHPTVTTTSYPGRLDATGLAHLYLRSFSHSSLQILSSCQVEWGVLLHSYFQVSLEMFE